jgi:hypothetical protein
MSQALYAHMNNKTIKIKKKRKKKVGQITCVWHKLPDTQRRREAL